MINEDGFSGLGPGDYELTSAPDESYNCIAYAAGVTDEWWEPVRGVWPEDVGPEDTISNLVSVYKKHGFEDHEGPIPIEGYEIIAIYGEREEGGAFFHAARRLPDGRWTSKMGADDDIAHRTLANLEGDDGEEFGYAVVFMKRKINP